MAKKPFTWPNHARVAFVLGIAFECWDRSKPSRGGALFPHLYGVLHVGDVHKVEPLPPGTDGKHVFPPLEP